MKKVKLPGTDIETSQIIYGCMKMGGEWNREPVTQEVKENAFKQVAAALEEGIDFFDHADIYVYGKSEEAFSYVLEQNPEIREKIILQSKCGIRFADDPEEGLPQRYDFSYDHIMKSVEGSLKRLGTDYLDILLLHRPDPLVEPEEVAKAFDELHSKGLVRFFGVSNHNGLQTELLKRYVDQPLIINQLEFNMIHNYLVDEGVTVNNRLDKIHRNDGTLEYCRLSNILIQAWSPVAVGKLFKKVNEIEDDTLRAASTVVHAMADEKGVSPEAIMLAWIMRHPMGIQPVIGTSKPERVHNSAEAFNVELSREEWYKLFRAGRGEQLP